MSPRPRFADRLDLAAVLTAVRCSRVFTELTLTRWGASAIVEDALLVTSELVTNAVKATGVIDPYPNWSSLGNLNLISVRLLGFGASIVIEVWDSDPSLPSMKGEDIDAESGRGLHIVAAIAYRWGSYPIGNGKVVWAELVAGPDTPGDLPKRPRSSPPVPNVQGPQHAPETLRRVRDGLRKL